MRRLLLACLSVGLIAVAVVGCNDPKNLPPTAERTNAMKFDLAAVRKIVEENNSRFTRAHVTGDAAVIDNMFTVDAKCLHPSRSRSSDVRPLRNSQPSTSHSASRNFARKQPTSAATKIWSWIKATR